MDFMSVPAAKPTRTKLHSFFFFILSFLNRFPLRLRYLQYIFMCTVFSVFAVLGVSPPPPPSHLFCIYFCNHCCIVSPSYHILVVPVLVSTTNYADAWKTRVNTEIRTATEICTRHESEINLRAPAGTKWKLEQSGLVQSRLFYSLSRSRMIVGSELEDLWKEVVQDYLEQFWRLRGDSELNG